jgi:hypothetical protein
MQQMSFLGHLFFAPYHYANSQYSSTLSRRTRSFAPARHALSSKRLTNTRFHKTFSSRQSILTITIVQIFARRITPETQEVRYSRECELLLPTRPHGSSRPLRFGALFLAGTPFGALPKYSHAYLTLGVPSQMIVFVLEYI